MQQISSLSENLSYIDKIILNENSEIELEWRVQNLELCNGWALIQPPAEVLIQTDASTKGWRQREVESKQGGCGLLKKWKTTSMSWNS